MSLRMPSVFAVVLLIIFPHDRTSGPLTYRAERVRQLPRCRVQSHEDREFHHGTPSNLSQTWIYFFLFFLSFLKFNFDPPNFFHEFFLLGKNFDDVN